jgi:class 3 adenylate cyclase
LSRGDKAHKEENIARKWCMKFSEVVAQTLTWLQRDGRVSYRAVKREFDLDDEYLEDLKEELIGAKRLASDEDGRFLVWTGDRSPESRVQSRESQPVQRPKSKVQSEKKQTRDSAGERRQLTVMFIDLVGSTTLSQQLDPEDYHSRVVAYQAACHQVIARYDGHIAQYLGDGVLVYFGYPAAHEDDAVRAVRSGLEIVTAVRQLAYTPPLQVRIGIHTGPVVVGEIGAGEHTERLALGETPNIAARVQGTAQPDEVMISAATYRLVAGLFVCEEQGQPELKGVTTPLTLYRVVKESEAHSRFAVAEQAGLTPLVGRDEELGLLRRRWEQAKQGEGQVVLLSGEPGIGKSRLVQTLKEQVLAEGATRLEFRCSPYHQNSAFSPIIDHLQRFVQLQREESAAAKLDKLAQTLATLAREHGFPFFFGRGNYAAGLDTG